MAVLPKGGKAQKRNQEGEAGEVEVHGGAVRMSGWEQLGALGVV
jgi:hypothetical protein